MNGDKGKKGGYGLRSNFEGASEVEAEASETRKQDGDRRDTETLDSICTEEEAMNVGGEIRHGSEDPNKDVNISRKSVSRTLLSELNRLDAETIDVQQLMVNKEEVPPEQQQWNPLVDQEDPEPPNIKEEREEPWITQDGLQLQGLEEADIKFTFTPVAVKSEEDKENLESSKLHQSERKENRADCGGPEPARNSGPDGRLQPGPEDKTLDSSETEDSEDDWMETREPQTGLNTSNNKQPPSDMGSKTEKKIVKLL
ncbi:unnamed protein product [Pleuronectes platessa]|uniref:Uncharacterized protein n=1 Tax=Pleuronectes platessa TaxID=8262 RepID=A0A9N7U2F2_PLEPL|nr:unnamed protein product [Pleuronectes platessa]